MRANGCKRIILSSEGSINPKANADVHELLRRLAPRIVTVVASVRPVAPWMLSYFSQNILWGLGSDGQWTVDRFSKWFGEDRIPFMTKGIEGWESGPWESRLLVMFMPPGSMNTCGSGRTPSRTRTATARRFWVPKWWTRSWSLGRDLVNEILAKADGWVGDPKWITEVPEPARLISPGTRTAPATAIWSDSCWA